MGKAAVVLVSTWPSATAPEKIALFRKNRSNGAAASAAANVSQRARGSAVATI